MDVFPYHQGELCAEAVKLGDLATAYGTPLYVYSRARLLANYRAYADAFGARATICYAVKANPNGAILNQLAIAGAGADVVSGGEMARAHRAGMAPDKIVFAGVGKTADELRAGLALGIRQFNVESLAELRLLADIAAQMGRVASLVLRINPDVHAPTHAKIATGKKDNKFGLPISEWRPAIQFLLDNRHLRLRGLGMHIGSQLLTLDPFAQAYAVLRAHLLELRAAGFALDTVDLGGGIGIVYQSGQIQPALSGLAELAQQHLGGLDLHWILEPGRSIIGDAGVLLTRVISRKHNGEKDFLVVDAAMNDLLRPTLYQAYHHVLPVKAMGDAAAWPVGDLVGPVCETGDYLAQDRPLPPAESGDLIAVMGAGAYGASMASTYNSRPLVAEAMVDGAHHGLIRRRQQLADLWADEMAWA
jgi:diaminopimelate decarboxylase